MNIPGLLQTDLFLQVVTSGRLVSIVAGLLGLVGIVIGWMAFSRSARRVPSARTMGLIALLTGLGSIVVSVSHLATAKGDFGTGSGRLGAIVALVIGIIGALLGGRTLSRVRRIAAGNNTATMPARKEKA